MIFVTVGLHDRNFNRLVQAADELSELLDEQVVIQRGCSDIIPQHASFFDWATSREMEDWIERSRVVISHAGAGTIILVLQNAKHLVLVPRLVSYNEHFNDHQLQLASVMEREGYATVVIELTAASLLDAVKHASLQVKPPVKTSGLIEAIRHQLNTWQEMPGKPLEE